MKLNYFIQFIRDCAFNIVFINVFFFFPLSAIANKLITNLRLDGYVELYYSFFIFFSLPLAILLVITKEIYKSIKRKSRFEKHLEADYETVPLLTTPRHKERGFFLQHVFTNSRKVSCCPVTYTPEARTSSPLALILHAALTSRSCCVPHEGQTQLLTESGSLLIT